MATSLDNRAELRNAFYLLTGTSSSDTALPEHETSSNDAIHGLLWQGQRAAQRWYLSVADPNAWITRATAITSWSTDAVTGDKYKALESDFIRLAGDFETSALMDGSGIRWGTLVDPKDQRRGVNVYWIVNRSTGDELRVSKYAAIPNTVYYDYYYEAPELTDDATAPDFPEEDRMLIVAFAADAFTYTAAFPGDAEAKADIRAYLTKLKAEISTRRRRTREPRKFHRKRAAGNHFFGRGS